jgi:hypothetical protein
MPPGRARLDLAIGKPDTGRGSRPDSRCAAATPFGMEESPGSAGQGAR